VIDVRAYAPLDEKVRATAWLPELDGIRALAALLIAAHHYAGGGFQTYAVANAVSGFYVLSGFLIYYLAETEAQQTGSISLWRFYRRRILRIWPLYFATIVMALVFFGSPGIVPAIFGEQYTALTGISTPEFLNLYGAPLALFGINVAMSLNFVVGYFWAPDVIAVLWSICVEEQFYLLFPFAFLFLRLNRHAAAYLVGLGVACLLLRIALVHAPVNYPEPEKIGASSGLYYFMFSYVPMFVWGGVAGWLYLNPDRAVRAGRVLAFPPMLIVYVVGLAGLGFAWTSAIWIPYRWYSPFLYDALAVLLFASLVWVLFNRSSPITAIFRWYPVRLVGMLSFALYCTHLMSGRLYYSLTEGAVQRFAFDYRYIGLLNELVLAIAISAVVHGMIERPFLLLKSTGPGRSILTSTTVPWKATAALLLGVFVLMRLALWH
jgi:peptidoglycan/LPS O-acetylase OafA/YrhL